MSDNEEEALPPRVALKRPERAAEAGGGAEPSESAPASASTAAHNAQLSWMAAAEEEVRARRARKNSTAP